MDAEIRDFHGYDAARGSTYNAYLVRDERTALIDAVRAPYAEQLLAAVAARCDPAQVAYVVCNHAEPDHSGALPRVMQALGGATLLCDARCRAALAQHYDLAGWKVQMVADGQTIPLGRRTLRFIETPMAHWPESMFTYVPEEKLLFSMDVFGQHYATTERFDEEVPARRALRGGQDLLRQHPHALRRGGGQVPGEALRRGPGDHRAQPRRDLAAGHGPDTRRLSRLGCPAAGGQGPGPLRHHVGEHGGDGRSDCRRGRR